MASSFSTDLKLELMVTGENAGTWGDKTNTNLNLIQQAIAGYQGVSIAGGAQTTALTMSNAALSNARNMVIEFTGTITGNQIVTIPDGIEKYYILKNSTTGAFTVTFKYASVGTGITLTQGFLTAAYGNGSEINKIDLTTLQGSVAAAQITNLAITTAKLTSFAVTTARINSLAVTSVKLASFAVTEAKLNTGAVTSTRLANTAVTPGDYTKVTITVDAQGRITSASSGAGGGAGMEIPTRFTTGPASGTHTAAANASRLGVYMYAGGGGGGGGAALPSNQPNNGGAGGVGGYGFYNKPITQPFSQPFAVAGGGGGGNGGNNSVFSGGAGSSGGNTTIANVGTVNGGTGGGGGVFNGMNGAAGTSGNQPSSNLSGFPKDFLLGPYGPTLGTGGSGGSPGMYFSPGGPENPGPYTAGQGGGSGNAGLLVVFENTGS